MLLLFPYGRFAAKIINVLEMRWCQKNHIIIFWYIAFFSLDSLFGKLGWESNKISFSLELLAL